mgnify:CR=1 FL=1
MTDADVVLGMIDPETFAGGTIPLLPEKSNVAGGFELPKFCTIPLAVYNQTSPGSRMSSWSMPSFTRSGRPSESRSHASLPESVSSAARV